MGGMDDLVQFLRARIDNETRWAQNSGQPSPRWYYDSMANEVRDHGNDGTVAFVPVPNTARHIARYDPARALAEADAKRQLIKAILRYEAKIDGEWGCCHSADEITAGRCEETNPNDITALRLLALPYARHPDYRDEWRPEAT